MGESQFLNPGEKVTIETGLPALAQENCLKKSLNKIKSSAEILPQKNPKNQLSLSETIIPYGPS